MSHHHRPMEENKIIIYQSEDGQTKIKVRLENDTWLSCSKQTEPQ